MKHSLFPILRLGLDLTSIEDEDISIINNADERQLAEIKRNCFKQAVYGVGFLGLQKVLYRIENKSIQESNSFFDWLGNVIMLEERNRFQLQTTIQLCNVLNNHNIDFILIKGQANGLYYPDSLMRSVGDVDCYLSSNGEPAFTEGNYIARDYGLPVEDGWYKHSSIYLNGETFENHQFFVTTREGKKSKQLESVLKSLINCQSYNRYPGTNILLPPTLFNALFLIYHSLSHFCAEGLRLKQVVDWVMFLKEEQDNIDWREFYAYCDMFNFRRFLDVMNDIAVHEFKLTIHSPEVTTSSPYTEKVLHSILFDEDFVFGSGKSGWQNRWHLITNMWKYRWKYNDIYETSIFKQFYYYASGYLFHTEK